MKRLLLLSTALLPLAVLAYHLAGTDFGAGDAPKPADQAAPVEPVVPADIADLWNKGVIKNAVLYNNASDRMIDPETKTMKGDMAALGKPVAPREVIILAESRVPDEMVKLYTSIQRLPDAAAVVRVLYTESGDREEATLLGYTVENPEDKDLAFVRYDGSAPWLQWITQSFLAIDAKLAPKTNSLKPRG